MQRAPMTKTGMGPNNPRGLFGAFPRCMRTDLIDKWSRCDFLSMGKINRDSASARAGGKAPSLFFVPVRVFFQRRTKPRKRKALSFLVAAAKKSSEVYA